MFTSTDWCAFTIKFNKILKSLQENKIDADLLEASKTLSFISKDQND